MWNWLRARVGSDVGWNSPSSLASSSHIRRDADVVAVLTGNVLKDPDYIYQYHTSQLKDPEGKLIDSRFGNRPVVVPNDAERDFENSGKVSLLYLLGYRLRRHPRRLRAVRHHRRVPRDVRRQLRRALRAAPWDELPLTTIARPMRSRPLQASMAWFAAASMH